MGSSSSSSAHMSAEATSSAAVHFSSEEFHLIKAAFKDLAQRSPGKTIDKRTFLDFFPLPGLHGERLFKVFDHKRTGVIDIDEFVMGLAACCKGTVEEKARFMFQLYDINGDNVVNKQELQTMLLHIPGDALELLYTSTYFFGDKEELSTTDAENDKAVRIVAKAFEECDLNKDGMLSYDQFKLWLERTPQVLDFLSALLPFTADTSSPGSVVLSVAGGESMRGSMYKVTRRLRKIVERHYVLSGNVLYYYYREGDKRPAGVIFLGACFVNSIPEGLPLMRSFASSPVPGGGTRVTSISTLRSAAAASSPSLSSSPSSSSGGFLSSLFGGSSSSKFYGIEIIMSEQGERASRMLYLKTSDERDEWLGALRKASNIKNIDDVYTLGKKIGEGRFSKVYECIHDSSEERFACKVMKKEGMKPAERKLIRTEIAILKLVRHTNIIRVVDIFEDMESISIVMELLKGGELFDRIVGRKRFSEMEAYLLLKPLVEAIAYLHTRGIVHRDIKPENILCGETLRDIKIADFGLSKIVAPSDKMKLPCGTLSYVAPEVLNMQGYGREADLWSCGVIMHLILRGKLPFDGDTKKEIIEATMLANLNLADAVWAKISPELRSLMRGLLSKTPAKRLSAQAVLSHPWMIMMEAKINSDAAEKKRSK